MNPLDDDPDTPKPSLLPTIKSTPSLSCSSPPLTPSKAESRAKIPHADSQTLTHSNSFYSTELPHNRSKTDHFILKSEEQKFKETIHITTSSPNSRSSTPVRGILRKPGERREKKEANLQLVGDDSPGGSDSSGGTLHQRKFVRHGTAHRKKPVGSPITKQSVESSPDNSHNNSPIISRLDDSTLDDLTTPNHNQGSPSETTIHKRNSKDPDIKDLTKSEPKYNHKRISIRRLNRDKSKTPKRLSSLQNVRRKAKRINSLQNSREKGKLPVKRLNSTNSVPNLLKGQQLHEPQQPRNQEQDFIKHEDELEIFHTQNSIPVYHKRDSNCIVS